MTLSMRDSARARAAANACTDDSLTGPPRCDALTTSQRAGSRAAGWPAHRRFIRTPSSSSHAVAKCSRLITTCAICERLLILESVSYSRRDVVRQQAIQRLGSSQLGLASASDEKQTTHLAENFVDVDVMLRDAVGELVELVDKVADVDTAHGVCLGERHLLREALPEEIGSVSVTRGSQK
jgi:hypothetical protein